LQRSRISPSITSGVRDIATATGLTAFGFVVGPFVYFGHERLWDRFTPEADAAPAAIMPVQVV
jgi:hypothetical protein